ncbi:MarR family transcriptional regulator [Roseospira goensis]|uniref:DNA-binding MarR family transcriptional regulator n=1 Tax=Roseospira goensis TaxID=391922 RepID=A0A7W6RW62_9PROT|nr:MarR family transcriptional regulator [Roseospira goensis]MBB4284330.1 DNA-binding MarR family transcriptional regulator [Roseospira goensis]
MGLNSTALTVEQALNLWRLTVVESVRRDTPDLSSRQMAVLLTVYLTPAPHTVRGLARALDISKPAITRALDRLGEYGLLSRQVDDADRRSVLVQRTEAGEAFLAAHGNLIVRAAETATLPRHETASVPEREVA